jgi:hypothetical protein
MISLQGIPAIDSEEADLNTPEQIVLVSRE